MLSLLLLLKLILSIVNLSAWLMSHLFADNNNECKPPQVQASLSHDSTLQAAYVTFLSVSTHSVTKP